MRAVGGGNNEVEPETEEWEGVRAGGKEVNGETCWVGCSANVGADFPLGALGQLQPSLLRDPSHGAFDPRFLCVSHIYEQQALINGCMNFLGLGLSRRIPASYRVGDGECMYMLRKDHGTWH